MRRSVLLAPVLAAAVLGPAIAGAQDTAPGARPEPGAAPIAPAAPDATDGAAAPSGAAATEDTTAPDAAASEGEDASEEADAPPVTRTIPRRAVPDYDGRPDPSPPPEEVALWIPRALLAPLRLIVDCLIRAPLGWLLTSAERDHWDLFRYLPFSHDPLPWGIVPTAFIDFGFIPSVGLFVWFDHAFAERNFLSMQVGFGGPHWLRATLVDRLTFSDVGTAQLTVDAWQRPDYVFLGLGPNARADHVARYGRRRVDAGVEVRVRPDRMAGIRLAVGVGANEFYESADTTQGQPTMRDAILAGWWQDLPPGFETGYFAYRQRLELVLDTRGTPPDSAGGVRLEAHGDLGFDMLRPVERRWALYGGAAGLYWDVSHGRTLGAWGTVELATALGPEPVPFTELPDLANLGRMPGVRGGWVTGTSAAAIGADYRWPVGPGVSGFLAVASGAAFGDYFQGFGFDLLRMSYSAGLRAGSSDQPFVVQVGLGSLPFREGGGIDVVRLMFGSQPSNL